ncbi:LacI family DNA-binding transcriptional regulator [Lactobacillus delbrueckii]|uniref:LacI family DNA-binding transcriptional regulator n=1 Tax=Lactobacillus delbrueckii TaxID=1584 RepID=UPI001E38CD89|nr:LacI family DNA-binding transcriptional regulator [Lactobacillus delbrueckii]MCD5445411.1 LacI family DNA-binding transcriptional regulator [Lactobacillus delbrueckii subsp. lactis]
MSDANEDIRETIWEYQVSCSELYRELNWPCCYSALTKRINGDVYMSRPMKQEIKEACVLISKRRQIASHLQEINCRETRDYIKSHGIKLKDVAKEIGLSSSALSSILSGNARLTDKRRREIINAVDELSRKEKEYD